MGAFVSASAPMAGWAQELDLEGVWIGGAFATAGISVGVDVDQASLIGAHVRIEGRTMTLPGHTECSLGFPQGQTWQNDMESFGSGGGDWADLGLIPDATGFAVQVMEVTCTGRFDPVALIWQVHGNRLLLDLRDRVYLALRRAENP